MPEDVFSSHVAISGEYETPRINRLFIDPVSGARNYGGRLTGSTGDMALTGHWKNFQKDAFFLQTIRCFG